MKRKMLLPIILVAGLMFVNFSNTSVYGQAAQKKTTKQQTIEYTCVHHPEVVQDKPGKCPKCGMQLIVKKKNGKMHQAKNPTIMKQDNTKMKHDSTSMKKMYKGV